MAEDEVIPDLVVVLSTFPSKEKAITVAGTLVEEKLAACVNVINGVTSIYKWKENIEKDEEVLCVIKTIKNVYQKLEKRLSELHPYDVPEIVALPPVAVLKSYETWAIEEINRD